MIIDSHTHIGRIPGTGDERSYKEIMEVLLKEADQEGVDKLISIAGLKSDEGITIGNDELMELASGIDKIAIVASFDINDTKKELDQLEDWIKSKKIVGVKMYTGYQHYYPSDERCRPIYEMCLKYDIPVIFHSGDVLAGCVPNPKVKYSQPLHIDDVATDLPQLKIIIAHMGNPWLIDCSEVLYKNTNVYADISGMVIGNDLNTPYGALMKKRIGELTSYVSPDFKLIYGTDWPLCPMKPYIDFSNELGLSPENLKKLFSDTAQKLFKL